MPNPGFIGNVPHRRCETCLHWSRQAGAMGVCANQANQWALPSASAAGDPSRLHPATTDLTVCSLWASKEE